MVQPFAYDEAHPYAAGQHRGIDIAADAAGNQVVAPSSGTVSFAGSVPISGESVTIETPDGYSVTLTHLGSLLASKGASVAEGDAVGTIGPSGTPEVGGPYVHLGIRKTSDPNGYLDPLDLLPPPMPSTPATATTPPVSQRSTATSNAVTNPTAPPTATSSPSGPAAPASAPPVTTRGANVRSSHSSSRGRPSGHAVDKARRTRSVRAAAPHPASTSARVEHPVATPHGRADAPADSSRRSAVEAAATLGRVRLDAGHELRPRGRGAQAQVRQLEQSQLPPPLAINGAAALVALGAAFAAGRGARRRRASAATADRVVRFPPPSVDYTPTRRAA